MIVLPDWLEDVFGDGQRPEPRRRYRNYLTIRISEIEPPERCTAVEADEFARDVAERVMANLAEQCDVAEWEIIAEDREEVEEY